MAGTSQLTPAPIPVFFDTEPTNTPDQFSFKSATFDEVLEELSSRFILNLPEDELAEVERVCFQVEQAHWYYEDFIREEKPSLPSLPLKKFSEILFRSCPLLHHWSHDHETAFNGFMNYKTRVPVCGAIMLNESLTKCVLVKGWKSSAGWGFPKGKVNENEDEALCAVREVAEETGYNLSGQIRKSDCIKLHIKHQPITLFVVPAVPEDFPFKTQTRKEISKIDWFKLADLPMWRKNAPPTNKFYLITPVIGQLKAIVRNLRKERKTAKYLQPPIKVAQKVSPLGADDQLIVEDSSMGTAVESPVAIDPSSRSQFGEVEVSSSQSSSIDPHTPSVNGDLAPHTSGALVTKADILVDSQDITDIDVGSISADTMSSGLSMDPRNHWLRLMTRLNNSEESSPGGTPQTATPTPPIASMPTPPEPLAVSPPHNRQTMMNGSTPVGLPKQEHSGATFPPKALKNHSNVVTRSASVSSVPLQPRAALDVSTPETHVESASASSTAHPVTFPDALARRTKQLQLLDSVLAEESGRRTFQQPPMSAHILGAYPHTSRGLFPDEGSVPIRPASVTLDSSLSQSTPFYHSQSNISISALSRVHPALAPPPSLHHQSIRSSQGYPPQLSLRGNELSTVGSPQTSLASHLSSTTNPATPLSSFGGNAIDIAHRGQMLSILSGQTSALRYASSGVGFRPGSAVHNTGALSRPSHRGFSSTTSIGVAPRSANAHLLSILNRPSVGRDSPVPLSVQTRQ